MGGQGGILAVVIVMMLMVVKVKPLMLMLLRAGSPRMANHKSAVKESTDTRNTAPTDWPAQRTDLASHRPFHRPENRSANIQV